LVSKNVARGREAGWPAETCSIFWEKTMKAGRFFLILCILYAAFIICFLFSFAVVLSIPQGGEDASAHKLLILILYIFVNVFIFLGLTIAVSREIKKTILYSLCVIGIELLFSAILYIYNLQYYANIVQDL
jgi:hypothetical protein